MFILQTHNSQLEWPSHDVSKSKEPPSGVNPEGGSMSHDDDLFCLLSKREMRHVQLARKILADIFDAFP
jgi:hypothetical protein